jgi:phosphomannomutase / phosphoglucomutase
MLTDKFRSMFREYDIRGRIAEDELTLDACDKIIRGFAAFLLRRGIRRCVVGYDNRKDSPAYTEVAKKALAESGLEVLDIGLALSPVMYFAQYHYESEGGVMVTASHNPDGWLGFKLGFGYSKTLGPDEIRELYSIIEKKEYVKGQGSVKPVRVREAYLDAIVSRVKMNPDAPPMRVVIDGANGAAGVFAYELFQRLGCLTFQLYCDPDVRYPQYFPESLGDEGAAAAGPDGDASVYPGGHRARLRRRRRSRRRAGRARRQRLERQGAAAAGQGLLAKKPGAKVVFDVKCTQALEDEVTRLGGTPIMCKTGHSFVKAKLHETGAELAGERSGHIFIAEDYYGFDDALFAGAKLLEYLSYQGKPVSEVLAELPPFVTSPEIKAHCADDVKYGVVDRLVEEFKAEYGDKVIDINGARVQFGDGWGLVRASSNLPELVLIFEAKTEGRMREIRQIFRDKLAKYPAIASEWENDI